VVEPERGEAIRLALRAAKAGDVVLLAGKGHEKEQILGFATVPFDDVEVALSALGEMGSEIGYGGVQ
jgi:UDP-N-acetylmuramoyl-L-alanyl-D-glutamate--2,6-diaminopimelate ligase